MCCNHTSSIVDHIGECSFCQPGLHLLIWPLHCAFFFRKSTEVQIFPEQLKFFVGHFDRICHPCKPVLMYIATLKHFCTKCHKCKRFFHNTVLLPCDTRHMQPNCLHRNVGLTALTQKPNQSHTMSYC